jgi:hypothetical protein
VEQTIPGRQVPHGKVPPHPSHAVPHAAPASWQDRGTHDDEPGGPLVAALEGRNPQDDDSPAELPPWPLELGAGSSPDEEGAFEEDAWSPLDGSADRLELRR